MVEEYRIFGRGEACREWLGRCDAIYGPVAAKFRGIRVEIARRCVQTRGAHEYRDRMGVIRSCYAAAYIIEGKREPASLTKLPGTLSVLEILFWGAANSYLVWPFFISGKAIFVKQWHGLKCGRGGAASELKSLYTALSDVQGTIKPQASIPLTSY